MQAPERVRASFERAVAEALREDLGGGGPEADVTTSSTVPDGLRGEAEVTAKAAGVVCGLAALEVVFDALSGGVGVELERRDGEDVTPGDVLARISGPVRPVLTGERTALNLLGHLSGIATLTRAFCRAAEGIEVSDTRKTLPGLRALEKYAVRTGGGTNHRFALWDGVLVKDNHVVAAGGVGEAVRRARAATTMPVQAECSDPAQVDEALDAGADALLLDNLGPRTLKEIVDRIAAQGRDVFVEASGGITLETARGYAHTGVDRISVGALTHSAHGLDVSLTLTRVLEGRP